VKLTYSDCTNSVKTELARSAWLKTSSGARQGSVLSPILFNSMMDKTANKVKGENKRPDMKTLIFADAVSIWWKDTKDTEKKLNQWNLTLRDQGLKTDTDKTVRVRMTFTDTMVKQVDRSIQQSMSKAYRPILNS
jgi:hypothetical protein